MSSRGIVRKRYRLSVIIVGIILLYGSLVAQMTSRLTPFLSRSEFLLEIMGNFGLYLLFFWTTTMVVVARKTKHSLYGYLALCSSAALLAVVFTLWGQVFQLSLAGISIGGSLVVLGYKAPSHLPVKK